jgi:hypothetical protein
VGAFTKTAAYGLPRVSSNPLTGSNSKMPNRTKRTPKKRELFLAALAEGCSITAACDRAVIVRSTAYDWRKADAKFAAAWDVAIEAGTDTLEDSALKRAKESSDTFLIFLLKARRPDKYKDRVSTEHSGSLAVRHEDALAALK